MASFEELKTQALALSLDGQEVGRYVLAQQTAEREERALEREERKRQDEMEERKREREFELAKLQAEKDLERARIDASSKPASPSLVGEYVDRPRLPAYQDGDDFASYLTRFERIAELLKVDKEAYAVTLGALLSGKAARIYTSLSPAIVADYTLLKKSLLKSFCKTPDGFRMDFRLTKIQPGETFELFGIQLGRSFDQWLEACNIDPTYASLRDLGSRPIYFLSYTRSSNLHQRAGCEHLGCRRSAGRRLVLCSSLLPEGLPVVIYTQAIQQEGNSLKLHPPSHQRTCFCLEVPSLRGSRPHSTQMP